MRRGVLLLSIAGLGALGRAYAQEDVVTRLIRQAEVLGRTGDYQRSGNFYREAARAAEASADPRLSKALSGLADTNDELGNFAEAEHEYRRALSLAEAAHGKRSPAYAVIAVNLGQHYAEVGQTASAEGMLRAAIGILEPAVPAADFHLAMARNCLAVLRMAHRRFDEAEKLLNQALEAYRQGSEMIRLYVGVTLTNLGALRRLQGRNAEAARFFQESVTSLESQLRPDHPLMIRSLNNLALSYVSLGNRAAAEATFDRALEVAAKRLGTATPVYAKVLFNYGTVERRFGNKTAAKEMEARARAILGENARINGTGVIVDRSAFQPHR